MKIAITSVGNSLDSDLDVHFGRCSYFVFYDTENSEHEFKLNNNRDADEKAGNMAVDLMISKKVEKVVSGIFGIKVKSLMNEAGIQMITFQKKITIREIISLLNHNKMEKKIAIPTRANRVDNHFGHCESYTIYTINVKGNIVNKESLPSPQGCGCKSNIASVLLQKGVSVMLAGNMGNGAFNVLTNHGIKVYRGCSGDVEELINQFISGEITDSGELCHAHDNDHECSHEK